MKVYLRIDGSPAHIEINEQDGAWHFDYHPSESAPLQGSASATEVEPGIYSVIWQGRSYEVKILWDNSSGAVDIGSEHFVIEAADPRELGAEDAGAAGRSRHEITAPMPGKVVRLLVEDQQEVQAGQGIVVVEAMKMQNELQSARAGRITAVRVKVGDAVAAGEVLAVVE